MQHAWIPLLQGHVWKRILPLTLVAALALCACGGGSSDKATATSASQSTTTSAATSAPATATSAATTPDTTSASTPAATTAQASGNDATSELEKMVANAWDNVTSYKITLNSYEGDATTPSLSTTTETMKPDKEHTVSMIAGATIESIRIGDDTYIKLGDTWQKSPSIDTGIATPESGDDVINDFVNPSIPNAKVVKKDDETIDGVTANVFEITAEDETVVTIWVGKDDQLPRKSEITSDTGRLEILYSDYGKDFGIKAPI